MEQSRSPRNTTGGDPTTSTSLVDSHGKDSASLSRQFREELKQIKEAERRKREKAENAKKEKFERDMKEVD